MSLPAKTKVKTGCLFFGLILSFFIHPLFAQTLPDSLVITKYRFFDKAFNWGVEGDSLTDTRKTVFFLSGGNYESNDTVVDNSLMNELLSEINNPDNRDTSLKRFGIDTNWIRQNPEKVLQLSTYYKDYKWNIQQKQLVLKALVDIKSYQRYLSELLGKGCCYAIDNYTRYQYKLSFYKKGQVINDLTSRRYTHGWRMPWTDIKGRRIYGSKIDELVNLLQGIHDPPPTIPEGKKLLKDLADYIVGSNHQKLGELAPYSYQKEIDELKPTFDIVSYKELRGHGGYHGDGPVVEIILHNSAMLPNLNIRFLAKEAGGTIYSRDSVMKDYKKLVERVQSIRFITSYLKAHPDEFVDMMYFNNKPINDYNIDGVNKTPKGWQKFDKEVTTGWLKNYNDTTSDGETARKVFERLDCGCNYRFESEFIGKAIMFLAYNGKDDFSRWFLLPDNTVLLYMTEGPKALGHDYREFSKHYMVAEQCVRFDADGNIIPKTEKCSEELH